MPLQGSMLPGLMTNGTPTLEIVKKGGAGEPNIQRFSASALNDQINDAVKALGDKTVVGLARVDLEGAHMTIVGKVPGKIPGELNWTVYVDKAWDGDFDAGIGVRWSI